jgi:hypothetical protein
VICCFALWLAACAFGWGQQQRHGARGRGGGLGGGGGALPAYLPAGGGKMMLRRGSFAKLPV